MSDKLPYLLVFTSTLLFSLSCLVYSVFSTRFSALWMNTVKAGIGLFFFVLATSLFYQWTAISQMGLILLLVSGFIGLGLGDLFLLRAFTAIGVPRTLMLFGFTPLFAGLMGFFFFGQAMDSSKYLAVVFLLACLFTFSFEGYRKSGRWSFSGVLFAVTGVSLDALGLGFTKMALESHPDLAVVEANVYRALGALVAFAILSRFQSMNLWSNFVGLSRGGKVLVVGAAFTGTFLSLWIYITAIHLGHMASIAAVGVTGPFFASLVECLYYKKWPSKYLFISGFFFICGFLILIY